MSPNSISASTSAAIHHTADQKSRSAYTNSVSKFSAASYNLAHVLIGQQPSYASSCITTADATQNMLENPNTQVQEGLADVFVGRSLPHNPATAPEMPKVEISCTSKMLAETIKNNLNLTHLQLTGAVSASDFDMLKSAKYLRHLDLSKTGEMDWNTYKKVGAVEDAYISTIPENCPNLRHINLQGCNRITDNGLAPFSKLNLETFNINNCDYVTSLGFAKNWTNLSDIQLKGCSGLKAGELSNLHNAKQLKQFALTNNNNTTASDFNKLFSEIHSLTDVSIGSNAYVTNQVLASIAKYQTHLAKLDISNTQQTSDEGMEHLSERDTLTDLNLTNCKNLSDKALEYASRLTNLTALNLSSCIKFTNTGIGHLSTLQKMITLTLHGLPNITEGALSDVASGVKNLVLSMCPGIKNLDGLSSVSQFTFVNLMGTHIADADLMRFTEAENLEVLSIVNCPNLTLDGVKTYIATEAFDKNEKLELKTNLQLG